MNLPNKKVFPFFLLFFPYIVWASIQGDACRLILGGLREPKPEDIFNAAVKLKEEGTGVTLEKNGRAMRIPKEHLEGLTQMMIQDFTTAANEGASPVASGNAGHMKDHFDFIGKHGQKLANATGIDLPSLKLAIAAHDIGKGFTDSLVAEWVKEKGNKYKISQNDPKFNEFIHNFVLAHEEHSIVRIPQVVKKYLQSLKPPISPESEKGQQLVRDYSLQIIEAMRQHNGIDVSGDLKSKYPSLTQAEIDQLRNSWWAENYRKYAEVMGLKKSDYGSNVNPIGEALNYIDRVVLTANSAPWKLMQQNLGFMKFDSPAFIRTSLVDSARGNLVLVKAQADRVRASIDKNNKQKMGEFNQVHEEAMAQNTRMIQLGGKLSDLQLNKTALFRRDLFNEGVTRNQYPGLISAFESTPPGTEYLYYRKTFPRSDGIQWIRVEGSKKKSGTVEEWKNGEWVEVPKVRTLGRSPVELLMDQIVEDRQWSR